MHKVGKPWTVAELVQYLSGLRSNLPVVIEDADTNWLLNITRIEVVDDCVVLSGEYGQEYTPESSDG